MIPGWLALGEIHERKAMRASHSGSDPTKRPSMAEQYAGSMAKTVAGAGVPPQQPVPPQQMPGPPPQGIAGLPQQPPQGYANGGIVSLAGGGQIGEIEAYIRARAAARHIDPDIAVRVARGEGGLSNPFRHGEGPAPKSQLASYGKLENSYGPFQLYVSGTGAGLGDRAVKAGIDPTKDWRAATDYALKEASQRGWGQWYGAKHAGITGMMGINGNSADVPVVATATDPTAAAATDAATTAATAGDAATSEAAAAGGDPTMSQMLLMSQLMGGKGNQPQAAPPPAAQVAQGRPVDASQYVQNPAFMARMRSRNYG